MKDRLENLFVGAPLGRLKQPTFAALALASMLVAVPALAQDGEVVEETVGGEITTGYSAMPVDGADAAERVIFQFDGGFDLMFTDFAETDGEVLFPEGTKVGLEQFDPDEVIRTQTNFVFGTLKLGTKKLFLPTFNTYASANIGFDLDGAPKPLEANAIFLPEELDSIEDSTEHRFTSMPQGDFGLFLHQAYAELDGFTDSGAGKQFSLRAGRQSHWGLGATLFDGATFGYEAENKSFNLALRGGQRAGVYEKTQDDLGLYGGLSLALDLNAAADAPLMIRAEYALFSRTITLSERDIERRGIEEETFTLNLAELAAYLDATDDILISLRLQLTDTNLSHIRTGLNWAFSKEFSAILDTDLKFFDGVPYDMTSGRGIKVIDQRTGFERTATHEVLRLNIPDRQPYADVQLQLPIRPSETIEIVPSGGLHLVIVDEEGKQNLSPYDATYFNFGLGTFVHSRISKKAILEAQLVYDGTVYQRNDDLVGAGLISDPRAGPENQSHRIFLGARYDRGTPLNQRYIQLQKRSLSVGLGAYLHLNVLEFRPYIENVFADQGIDRGDPGDLADNVNGLNAVDAVFENEVMFGTQFFVKWWATEFTALQLSHEFAQDSDVFFTHMAPFQSIRLSADITF